MIVALMGLKQMAIFTSQVGLAVLTPEKIVDWITDDIPSCKNIEKIVSKKSLQSHPV